MRARLRRRRRDAPAVAAPTPLVASLLAGAQRAAADLRHDRIGTAHVLLALLAAAEHAPVVRGLPLDAAAVRRDVVARCGEGPAVGAEFDAAALRALGIDLDVVRARTDEAFGAGALDRAARARGRCGAAGFGISRCLKRALEQARLDARRAGREITVRDVLAALAAQRDSRAALILDAHGVSLEQIRGAPA
jgi:ATP-dependent Clp protease ATP-binding subunit ClpA